MLQKKCREDVSIHFLSSCVYMKYYNMIANESLGLYIATAKYYCLTK